MRLSRLSLGVAVVSFSMLGMASTQAASAQTVTPTHVASWHKGAEADKVTAYNTMYVRNTKAVRELCTNYTKADTRPSCKLGKKKADGTRALIPAGWHAVRTPRQLCGETKSFYGYSVLRNHSREYTKNSFEFLRTCDEPFTQVTYFSGKGSGVKYVNRKCDKSSLRVRIWRLYPGRSGNIIDPGVLTVPLGNGLNDTIGDEPGEVMHVPFTRVWEFYQESDMSNRKVDMSNPANIYANPVASTSDARPYLRLFYSGCMQAD